MNLGHDWNDRALQQLVRYEALFKLLDEIQGMEQIAELVQPIARQWKHFARVASWRLVVADGESFTVIDGSRGEASVTDASALSEWDAYNWLMRRPRLLRMAVPPEGPPPPDFLAGKAVGEIIVLPFFRASGCIALLSAAARHEPFGDLDTKFLRIFGSHFADRVSDILYRARTTRALVEKATQDALTGLLNRGAIIERLQSVLALSRRTGDPLSVVLCDIDFFKLINDSHGHLAGDKVLREVAGRLKTQVREGDHLGRYGGEEFLAVLYPCAAADAVKAAERFRRAVADALFPLQPGATPFLPVTISLGTACKVGADSPRLEDLLKRADDALYRAKAEGRNRVMAAEDLAND
ncbi:MAG: GGDEF domain-containing protein [Rhodocyclaceae bacterium]